jgi:hypothetical protein
MRQLVNALAVAAIALGIFFIVDRLAVPARRRVWLVCLTLTLGGGVTMMTAHAFVARWAFNGDNPRLGLFMMMDGTAYRPFVYRRLTPEIVRAATDFALPRLPPRAIDYLLKDSPLRRYRGEYGGIVDESWNPRKAVAFHIAYWIIWLAMFGTLLVGAALCATVRRCTPLEAIVTASLCMCLLPLLFFGGGYVYDAMEFFFWTSLLLLVLRDLLIPVPLLFALMLMNKESALLGLPALVVLIANRRGKRQALLWGAALGILGIGWLWFVRTRYAGQPGQPMEFWLGSNLAFWGNASSYFLVTQNFSPGLLATRGANVVLLLLLLIPLRAGWGRVPPQFRWATVLQGAILFPLFVANGYRDEIRNLALLFPFLLIIAIEGVHAVFGTHPSQATDRP